MYDSKSIFSAFFFLSMVLGPSVHAARLGDIPDEDEKKQRVKEKQTEDDIYTPEERKQLFTELSSDYYKKGLAAMRQNNLPQAKAYFEKVLALSPKSERAREKLNMVNVQLEAKRKAAAPKPSPSPQSQARPSMEPLKSIKKVAPPKINPGVPKKQEIDKDGSDELYFQALTASQKKDRVAALDLCKRALALNPDNLQAQRMLDRLSQ